MSQLNLKQILPGDNLSTVVDKLNYNFDQIVLNGGGPQGLRGILGAPGLPGIQGTRGETGATGEHGTYIFADGASPGDYPFGTGGEGPPRIGDIFIETDPYYINIWELGPSGDWILIEQISMPSGSIGSVFHQNGTGPEFTDMANDPITATKLFIGSSGAFTKGVASNPNIFFDIGFSASTLVLPLSIPVYYADSLATFASESNQIRILSNGLSGASGSAPTIGTNRGGIVHSLEGYVNGLDTFQTYRIINADSLGEKYFSMGFNRAANQVLLFGDTNNKLGVGTGEFENFVAQLSVKDSASIGDKNFYETSVFLDNKGTLVQGNLGVGITGNLWATGTFFNTTSPRVLIDTNSSTGVSSAGSEMILSDNWISGYTPGQAGGYWGFKRSSYFNPSSTNYGSLSLRGFRSDISVDRIATYWGLTADSGTGVESIGLGIDNDTPHGLVEIGYDNFRRVGIGQGNGINTGSIYPSNEISSYLSFNLHRSPVKDGSSSPWVARNDGSSHGQAIWSDKNTGNLNIAFMWEPNDAISTYDDDDVISRSSISMNRGRMRIALDGNPASSLFSGSFGGGSSLGLYIRTLDGGSTGSGYSQRWRRGVAGFGAFDENVTPGFGASPVIFNTATTDWLSVSQLDYKGSSILPQYSFYGNSNGDVGSVFDTCGLFLIKGTTANPLGEGGTSPYENVAIGLAVGGTVGLWVQGSTSSGIRSGVGTRNPLERFQIGDKMTFHDGAPKYFGYNLYYDPSLSRNNRITPDSTVGLTQEGYAQIVFEDIGITSSLTLERFTNVGTSVLINLAQPGNQSSIDYSGISPNGQNFRGMHLSPPPMGPSGYSNLSSYTPQVGIGVAQIGELYDTSARRGTLSVSAQMRTKPDPQGPFGVTIEDYYNIGLYSYDGYPVAGIQAAGGNENTYSVNSLSLNFLGKNGNALYEDISVLYADSDITNTRRYQRRAYFGDGFRVGINEVPNWINAPLSRTSQVNGNCFDVASLIVNPGAGYYSNSTISQINRGALVIDHTANYVDYGLVIKNGAIYNGPAGQTFSANSANAQAGGNRTAPKAVNTYLGDWVIKYDKFISNKGNIGVFSNPNADMGMGGQYSQAGLHITKPGSQGYHFWIDDTGGVCIGYNSPIVGTTDPTLQALSTGGYIPRMVFHNTSYKLFVNGRVAGVAFDNWSDRRLKENFSPITNELQNILQLQPTRYNFIGEEDIQAGFIAQEVEKIYPDLVKIMDDGTLEGGKKTLNYIGLVPILTRGIQEQQAIIDAQAETIKNLEDKISKIENILAKFNLS